MTGKQARDISASVRARLMTVAKFNNEAFDLVLVRFAIERLLYRLSRSPYREQFVVKGAMMFQVWSKFSHRPTRDLDLLGTGEPTIARMIGVFRDLCTQEPKDDGIVFIADTIAASKIKEDQVYEGIRMPSLVVLAFLSKLTSGLVMLLRQIPFSLTSQPYLICQLRNYNPIREKPSLPKSFKRW